ncbi:MAG: hypothetical protein ACRD16_09375 [Thermoanaerobaculia bacterium]
MKRALTPLLLAAILVGPNCASVVREAKQGFFFIGSEISRSEIRMTLDRAFVDRYKDRATIEVTFTVDRAGRSAHPSYLDGDLHVAGRAAEIGLPIVAEVENARSQKGAVEAVHRAAESGEPVQLTGVWRLWSEHVGSGEQTQGESLNRIERTNPPHVFEVHPVTRIDGLDLSGTFVPVNGFQPEPATVVFGSLKTARCRITKDDRALTIFTRRREYNDADFVMTLLDFPPQIVSDGRFVRASVSTPKGGLLAEDVRMVFVRGTPPEERVKALKPGDRMRVFGIPRIDLSQIASRLDRASEDPGGLNGSLPYEIVVVGVLGATP